MKTDPALTCESCVHMRDRKPKDVKVEAGHDLDRHWCQVNDMPTTPGALRCGGDDYLSKNAPWRCRICKRVWKRSELVPVPDPTARTAVLTCRSFYCGGTCDPVKP
jgi:hypothetical protein